MRVQYSHKLTSSLLLFLDHVLLNEDGYKNTTGQFHLNPKHSHRNNYWIYSSSYKQLCNDTSVTGANVMTGVYVNSSFVPVGTSGIIGINHFKGEVLSSSPITGTISGIYSVKDFNIKLSDKIEEKLFFDTKWSLFDSPNTGLAEDNEVYPIIMVRPLIGQTDGFCLGGAYEKLLTYRLTILADNQYSLLAATDILERQKLKRIKIYDGTLPIREDGLYTGLAYNYDNLASDSNYSPLIKEVKTNYVTLSSEYSDLPDNVKIAYVNMTISSIV